MNWHDRRSPTYCNRTTPPVRIDASAFRVQIDAPSESEGQIYVIYRHAPDDAALERSPWQWDYIDPFHPRETATEEGLYQFRVLCTVEAGLRGWKGLTILREGDGVAGASSFQVSFDQPPYPEEQPLPGEQSFVQASR